jgi:hypothetical protein
MLVTWETEISRTATGDQLGKKVQETPCQPVKPAECGDATHHPSCEENVNKRTAVQAGPGINLRPYLKNKESKKGWEFGSGGRVPTYQV